MRFAPSRRRVAALLTTLTLALTLTSAQSAEAQATFSCTPAFYLATNGQLSKFETSSGAYTEIGPQNAQYDGVGLRPADGYKYATSADNLVRIDAAGNMTVLGDIGVEAIAGDFGDDGRLHILSTGRESWYSIDVTTLEVTENRALAANYQVNDFANVHGKFYGMSTSGNLWEFDPVASSAINRGAVANFGTGSVVAAVWGTAGGNLYVGQQSGAIYQITGFSTYAPTATLVADGLSLSFDDSSGCGHAAPPVGIRDVDGPTPETAPSTPEAQAAATAWTQEYEARESTSYEIEDAGVGEGPSCDPTIDEDRLPRLTVAPNQYTSPTTIYSDGFDGTSNDWLVLSGYWEQSGGDLKQLRDCGYDYTVLLPTPQIANFRFETTVRGLNATNQGGVVFNVSGEETRSGAMVVDLANGGSTLRWGTYDNAGYYQFIGSTDVTSQGSDTIAVIQQGNAIDVEFNGQIVGSTTTANPGGYVGLVSSVSAVAFEQANLVALPAS